MPVRPINMQRKDSEQGRTENIRCLEFPRRAGHSVNCISAAHADCEHPKATSVGRVRVYQKVAQLRVNIDCRSSIYQYQA